MTKVYVQISVETEERADRWACWCPEFGFFVYGATREAARQEVNKALTALLGSFHGDLDAIEQFLKKRDVRYYSIQRELANPTDQVVHPVPNGKESPAIGQRAVATDVSVEEVLIA